MCWIEKNIFVNKGKQHVECDLLYWLIKEEHIISCLAEFDMTGGFPIRVIILTVFSAV